MLRINKVKLLGIGILPLIVGIVWICIMILLPHSTFIKILIEFALFILWGYVSFRAADFERNPIMQAFMLCAVSLLLLVFALYQEFAMDEGFVSQMYFVPFVSFPSFIMFLLRGSVALPPVCIAACVCIAAWIGMFIVSCAGCYIKCRL